MSLIQLCEDSAGQQVNISEIFLRKEENSESDSVGSML